jgi:hypothetical protein
MSFDKETGELWTGDVGQNSWEEVDIIQQGKNYGWKSREGTHPFDENNSNQSGFENPIHEYGRRSGGSITGGYVYRGKAIPSLVGSYIFSDYLSKKIWKLTNEYTKNQTQKSVRICKSAPISISSFGETPEGEIVACGFSNPYATKGRIYLLVPSEPALSTSP